MRVDGSVIEQIALRREADELAARAESRIECEYTFLSQGVLQQQLAEIRSKDAYSLSVGFLFRRGGKLRFDGRFEQPLVAILHRLFDLIGGIRVVAQPEVGEFVEGFLLIAGYIHSNKPFGLGASYSQQPVRLYAPERFVHRPVLAVISGFLCALLGELFDLLGADHCGVSELTADGVTRALVDADLFGNNVPCAL